MESSPTPTDEKAAAGAWLPASRALTALLVLLALLALLRVAAPFALKHLVEVEGTNALGRAVEVGGVDLSLLAGSVGLDRLYVGPPLGGTRPAGRLAPGDVRFGARRIELDMSVRDLLRGDVRVDAILIDTPRVLRLRDLAGSLPPLWSAAGLDEDAGPQEGAAPDAGSGRPIALNRLSIVNASFDYFDLARPERRPLEITLGALELEGVTFVDGEVEIATAAIRAPALRVMSDFGVDALQPDRESALDEAQSEAGAATTLAEAAVEPDAAPPSESPRVRIRELTLRDAEFALLQAGDGGALDTALDLTATDISLDPGARFPVELTLQVESGSVTANGQAGLAPAGFDGAVGWEALPLADIARSLGSLFPAQLTSGTSSGALELSLSLGAPSGGAIQISGRSEISDFALTDSQGVDVGWQELAVVIDELAIDPSGERPPRIALASLALRAPDLKLLLEERAEADESTPASTDAEQPLVRIAELDVSGGTLRFEDTTVKPRHRSEVREFVVRASDLRWPERTARAVKIDGRADGETAISANGTLGSEESDLDLVLSGLALKAFSPYIADLAGYWIDEGQVDLKATLSQRGETTDLDSSLVFRRLSVTSVDPGTFQKQFGVPLNVALALLRDPKGNIRLPVTLRLERDTSRVDLLPIVFASLRQALIGALTSPLKGLGLLLEFGDDDASEAGLALTPVAFEPGSVTLSASENVAQFGELLGARPGIALRLRGRLSPDDARGIAERVLIAKLSEDTELPEDDLGFLQRRRIVAALKERAAGEAGELDAEDSADLAQWLDSVTPSESDRAAFARSRVEALRAALLEATGVDEARISIGDALEGAPGVVVELSPTGS